MSIAINIRFLRAILLEHMRLRSVFYTRARGLTEWRVVWAHVMENSLIPIITATGMHLGEILGGAVIAIFFTHWAWYARIVRGIVISLKNREFVLAARVAGTSRGRIVARHILPALAPQLLLYPGLAIFVSVMAFNLLGDAMRDASDFNFAEAES